MSPVSVWSSPDNISRKKEAAFSKMNLSGDSLKVKAGPLKAPNFFSWSEKVKIVFRGRGIWKYVDTAKSVTVTLADGTRQKTRLHVIIHSNVHWQILQGFCDANTGSSGSMENSIRNSFFSDNSRRWCITGEAATCKIDEQRIYSRVFKPPWWFSTQSFWRRSPIFRSKNIASTFPRSAF